MVNVIYCKRIELGGKIAFRKRVARKTTAKKRSSPKAKPIKLNPKYWLRGAGDIKKWSDENIPSDGLCPILRCKPRAWNCDHDHFDSKVRGMISQAANTWEGYVLKSFSKYCNAYTDLSLSEALRNMADYLESSYWIDNKLHFRAVEDMRKHLNRCTKETIARKALEEYGLVIPCDIEKADMVYIYLEKFISLLEETVWE